MIRKSLVKQQKGQIMKYQNISSDLSLRSAANWTGDVEIRGCTSFVQDGQTHVEEASEHDAEFWGVYLPQKDGRTMWYSDHDTKAQAESMVAYLKDVGPVDMNQLFQVIGSDLDLVVDSRTGKIIQGNSTLVSEDSNHNWNNDSEADDYLIQLAFEFAGKTPTREKFRNVMISKFNSECVTDIQRQKLFDALKIAKGTPFTEFKNTLDTYWSKHTKERKDNRRNHKAAVAESNVRQIMISALKASAEFNAMYGISNVEANDHQPINTKINTVEHIESITSVDIDRFNVDEALNWVKSYQSNDLKKLAGESFDILAVGYWNKDGSYTEPETEYRQEIAENYWQNQSPFQVLITDQDNEVLTTLNTHFNPNGTLSFEPKRPDVLPVSDDSFTGLSYSMQIEVNDALQNGGTFILTENGDWHWPHEVENKALPEYSFRVAVDDSLPLTPQQEVFIADRDIPSLDDVQYQINNAGFKF